MWSISEVKRKGREAFKANYWKCVLAAVVMALLLGNLLPSFNFNSDGTTSSSFENLSPTLSIRTPPKSEDARRAKLRKTKATSTKSTPRKINRLLFLLILP